jgi:hypothetical protein
MSLTLLVDGHMHIHPSFDLGRFFASAERNFRAAAAAQGLAEGQWRGALLLVESGKERAFERLATGQLATPPGVRLEQTADAAALRVYIGGGEPYYLFAGRQIATTSGVEVLTLATRSVVPDRLPFTEAMDRACATDGFAAIPWGFGKWSLARGELVRNEILRRAPGSIGLGDNGGRLSLAPVPELFKFAEQRGFVVLPGSDPFPFPEQVERVASFGFMLEDWQEQDDAPARTLLARLRGLRETPPYFGRLTGLGTFAISQVRMQLHNRLPGRAS